MKKRYLCCFYKHRFIFTKFRFSTLVVQGDITTSGSITAQSFNTEIVSSSVIFESGSTRFGDTIDDSHNMTGSLFVSGNITFDTNLTGSITSTGSFGNLVVGGGGISSEGDITLDFKMLFLQMVELNLVD